MEEFWSRLGPKYSTTWYREKTCKKSPMLKLFFKFICFWVFVHLFYFYMCGCCVCIYLCIMFIPNTKETRRGPTHGFCKPNPGPLKELLTSLYYLSSPVLPPSLYRISLCSSSWWGTHAVDQAGLKVRDLPASASSYVLGLKLSNIWAQHSTLLENTTQNLGVIAQPCNFSTWNTRIGNSMPLFSVSLGYLRPSLKKQSEAGHGSSPPARGRTVENRESAKTVQWYYRQPGLENYK